MLLNVTYPNKKIRHKINMDVGKPIPLVQRIRMGGSGSRRMYIKNASQEISSKLHPMHEQPNCNIEIRPLGVIIRFISGIDTLAWIIRFSNLDVELKENEVTWSDGTNQVTVYNSRNDDNVVKIGQKCLDFMASLQA